VYSYDAAEKAGLFDALRGTVFRARAAVPAIARP
jgi:hypothetical protein